jgi:hypothetical protein
MLYLGAHRTNSPVRPMNLDHPKRQVRSIGRLSRKRPDSPCSPFSGETPGWTYTSQTRTRETTDLNLLDVTTDKKRASYLEPGALGAPGAPGAAGAPGAPGAAGAPGAPGAPAPPAMDFILLMSSSVNSFLQKGHFLRTVLPITGSFLPQYGQLMSISTPAGLKHMLTPLSLPLVMRGTETGYARYGSIIQPYRHSLADGTCPARTGHLRNTGQTISSCI